MDGRDGAQQGKSLTAITALDTAWMTTATWNTRSDPCMAPIFTPDKMNAAVANVPLVAVPILVAAIGKSVVMPCIDTVKAFTAKEAWICVEHHNHQRQPRRFRRCRTHVDH